MKRKVAFLVVAIAVVLGALLVTTVTRAKPPFTSSEALVWELTRVSTVGTGQVVRMEEGTFIQGMVVQAQARARSGRLVTEGTFRLILDVFTPSRDMPGQRAGMNYVVGDWTITREGASTESANARHSPDVLKGRMQTELSFNPATDGGRWSARAILPMSPAAGRWGRGQGALSFDGRGAGSLTLDATLGPTSVRTP